MTNSQQTTIGAELSRRKTKLLFCIHTVGLAVGVHSLLFVDSLTVTLAGVSVPAIAFYIVVSLVGSTYFGLKLLVES